jgi:acetolactate synthase I/II/III large subunit
VTTPSAALAHVVAEALAAAGTTVAYGVPGGGINLDVIGACERAGIRFVLTHAETPAAIMAAVHGDLTGAPGACVVTRGPGAASAVNGVAQAMLDRSPMLLLTDAGEAGDAERVSHQRLDQQALFEPVTKWSTSVGLDSAHETVAAAVALATAAPAGPVHLALVPDAPRSHPPSLVRPRRSDDAARERGRRLLAASEHPVFALGLGATAVPAPVRRLLEGRPWPVVTTYRAKGVVPERWPNSAGLLTGARIEAPVLDSADLIVAVGLDPVELIAAPWRYEPPVLSLTEWPLVDRYFIPELELIGELPALMEFVAATLPAGAPRRPGRAFRLDAEAALDPPSAGLGPQQVVRVARELAPPGTIATVDSGAHMLVTMPLWEVDEPQEALISSGLATMGYALPAAVAASLARPERQVVCFTGDGGLGMAVAELETIRRLTLPIVVVVFNDSALSLIEVKQAPHCQGGSSAVRYECTDFAAVARGFGVPGRRAADVPALESALAEGFAHRTPMLVDVTIDAGPYAAIFSAVRD